MHEDPVLPFSVPDTGDANTPYDDVKTTSDDVKTTTDDVKTTADDLNTSPKKSKWGLLRQRQGGNADVRCDVRLSYRGIHIIQLPKRTHMSVQFLSFMCFLIGYNLKM